MVSSVSGMRLSGSTAAEYLTVPPWRSRIVGSRMFVTAICDPAGIVSMVVVLTATVPLATSLAYTATTTLVASSSPLFQMFRTTTGLGSRAKTAEPSAGFTTPAMVRSTWAAGPTVTCAVPFTPSAAAVTVVVPSASVVKNPVSFTVPTVSLLLDQSKETPEISLPAESFAVALNCRVPPIARFTVSGDTSMVVRAGVAPVVTMADPFTPSAAAVTVVVPAARAVKYPVWFTVPTVSLLLDQSNVTSIISMPSWSFAVAVNCCVPPTARFVIAGETSITVRTGATLPVE